MYTWNSYYFQDSNSPIMDYLSFFHDYAIMIIILIVSLIMYIVMKLFCEKNSNQCILQNNFLEIVWTMMPMMILFFLAIPSLKILYLTEEYSLNPVLTIKALGHQWYWSYEYSNFSNIEINSFMIPSDQLELNSFRLLDTDNRLILPYKLPIRLLVSSVDVIHSWTLPSLGIKLDAIPGRMNQIVFNMIRPGIYFGQCSEICGANHSFMPIMIESTNLKFFLNWIENFND